ncbi:NlpC/P60 family protein [Dactylosporangium sp. NPDC000244]
MEDTKPVAKANLRPGDLVFFYSDPHHMGMYAGGG